MAVPISILPRFVCRASPRTKGTSVPMALGSHVGFVLARCCSLMNRRETKDHGPVNTWARVSYFTNTNADGVGVEGTGGSGGGGRGVTHDTRDNVIRKNLIINGYNGVFGLDHDDGSTGYNDSSNVLLYGGCKQVPQWATTPCVVPPPPRPGETPMIRQTPLLAS